MTGARPSKSQAAVRRRQQILEATRELLRERDADKVFVADVAARAGLSVATIYNLIGTRDRLLLAVLDDTVERIDQLVAVADAASVDQCLQIISVACDVVLADPHPQRAVVGAMGSMDSDVWIIDGLSSRLVGDNDTDVRDRALQEMAAYFLEQIADRRANPTNDLIGHLVTVEVEGASTGVSDRTSPGSSSPSRFRRGWNTFRSSNSSPAPM